jgi:vacuolar-type H+-ATPase subunit E/Vma4
VSNSPPSSVKGSPARRTGRPDTGPALEQALAPVVDALILTAEARAAAAHAEAREAARIELTRARAEARQLLAEARAEGTKAAVQEGVARVALARREALGIVLAARRVAYETLRQDAVEALVRHSATPEGRLLAERLLALVGERVGPGASVQLVERDGLEAQAECGNRRAALGPDALVDQVLASLATEVGVLWT